MWGYMNMSVFGNTAALFMHNRMNRWCLEMQLLVCYWKTTGWMMRDDSWISNLVVIYWNYGILFDTKTTSMQQTSRIISRCITLTILSFGGRFSVEIKSWSHWAVLCCSLSNEAVTFLDSSWALWLYHPGRTSPQRRWWKQNRLQIITKKCNNSISTSSSLVGISLFLMAQSSPWWCDLRSLCENLVVSITSIHWWRLWHAVEVIICQTTISQISNELSSLVMCTSKQRIK